MTSIALGAFMLAFRNVAMTAAKAFSRNGIAAVILSSAAFIWAAAIVYVAPLDFLVRFKMIIIVALVLAAPISWFWMSDLLAPRALGGILVLLPAPVLLASRFVDSNWRLVVITLMYVYVVAGMAFIMSPYYFRDFVTWLTRKPVRFTVAGAISAAIGVMVVTAGLR